MKNKKSYPPYNDDLTLNNIMRGPQRPDGRPIKILQILFYVFFILSVGAVILKVISSFLEVEKPLTQQIFQKIEINNLEVKKFQKKDLEDLSEYLEGFPENIKIFSNSFFTEFGEQIANASCSKVDLVILTPRDLGFINETVISRDMIFEKAKKQGLKFCTPEIMLALVVEKSSLIPNRPLCIYGALDPQIRGFADLSCPVILKNGSTKLSVHFRDPDTWGSYEFWIFVK